MESLGLNQTERLRSLTILVNLKQELERLGLNLTVRLRPLSILVRIKVYSGDSGGITDLSLSANSTDLGRGTVNDLEERIIMHKCKIRLGSGTKLDELRKPLKISLIFICIFFSTCGAEYFREKIEERWRDIRKERSTVEQSWLIPHPTRSAWSDSREFHKVSLVKHIVGYKLRINNQNDSKCMDIGHIS